MKVKYELVYSNFKTYDSYNNPKHIRSQCVESEYKNTYGTQQANSNSPNQR